MTRAIWNVGCLFLLLSVFPLEAANSTWPEFRGPTGQGIVPGDAKLPLEWSEEKNIRWKTPIHGRAWSSPVSDGKRIWLSTATTNGMELSAVCVDFESGKVVHASAPRSAINREAR